MTDDQLDRIVRYLTRRQPFRPFEIEMESGDRLLVSHPESIVREGDFFVYRGTDRGHRLFTGAGVCQVIVRPRATPS